MSRGLYELVVGLQLLKLGSARIRQHLIKHRANRFNIQFHHTDTIGQSADKKPRQSAMASGF